MTLTSQPIGKKTRILMGLADLTSEDYEPFQRYLENLKGDPLRIAIFAAHNFVEEMIEKAIAVSVSNSEVAVEVDSVPIRPKAAREAVWIEDRKHCDIDPVAGLSLGPVCLNRDHSTIHHQLGAGHKAAVI